MHDLPIDLYLNGETWVLAPEDYPGRDLRDVLDVLVKEARKRRLVVIEEYEGWNISVTARPKFLPDRENVVRLIPPFRKFRWKAWLNGEVWEFHVQGDWADLEAFRSRAYAAAARAGLSVKTRKRRNVLVLQAVERKKR